ncbi:MAG: cation:dicarboxylase symporter family transporter [Pseudomonadales bacterium]
MSFTRKILTGLCLGVLTGLFLGELAAPMNVAGEIYIGLLQMTVLPYIVISLIANLGRITWTESRHLILAGIAILGIFLLIGIGVLFAVPIAFPERETAAFFNDALIMDPPTIDLIALYVPSNPFASLADNVVPAAVLFSILLGIGLSSVPKRQGLLRGLDVLASALNQVNKLVIRITPIGVFAIASGTAGTLSLEELSRLQAYLLVYTALVLILTLLVLPMLIAAVTPFRFREILAVPRDTLLMIFATGKIIVLMPQLIENVKMLFARHDRLDEQLKHDAEVLLPLAYPFPNLGTYIILLFIPFGAWYMGRSLELDELLTLQGASLLSSFVAPIIGIPFPLDLMRLPADLIDLFTMSTVYTDRIRVVLGGMHLYGIGVIVLSIRCRMFRVDWARLAIAVGTALVAVLASLTMVRGYLSQTYGDAYEGDSALVEMRWMERTVPARHYRDTLPESQTDKLDRLTRIASRGTLRVGYLPDALPFAFTNPAGEVVGFDIELAHELAQDLGASLELVRISADDIDRLFEEGRLDIVMSGLAMTPDRLRSWRFGGSALDLTLALLVPDHQRKRYEDFTTVREMTLKVGMVQHDPAFQRRLESALPNASILQIDSPRRFLRGEAPELDAVIYSAQGGAAWTLIYPDFAVVVPKPKVVNLPAGYPVPTGDDRWAIYVHDWLTLRKKDGTVDALFDHWIRGRGVEEVEPRWSVLRNVLGWVD